MRKAFTPEHLFPALALVSISLIFWQNFGMNKSLQIFPAQDVKIVNWNDSINDGNSTGKTNIRDSKVELQCELKRSQNTFAFCGYLMPLQPSGKGMDLTRYDSLDVELSMTSSSKDTIILYLLNEEFDTNGNKFKRSNARTIYPGSNTKLYSLDLNSFSVPSWWLFSNGERADGNSEAKLNNVTHVQISSGDNTSEREEIIEVSSVSLKGKWISKEQLYLSLILLWCFIIIINFFISTLKLRKKLNVSTQKANELNQINRILKIEKDKFETLAKVDPLTGAYNRAGVRDILDRILHQQDSDIPCSLIMLDIDYFKRVNDTLGHDAGDDILINLVKLIQSHTRESDHLVRWGGEEFALICENTSEQIAINIANKLCSIIAQHKHFIAPITCSFGVSKLTSMNIEDCFKEADVALYNAKGQGRNRVVIREFA
ncbi:GGDEF domain-containing protein [Thalassotalea aquiviva]|uniref:GGDEF domain-containing protein n=1 Tax=Thalassotalea aquiviva TaxID=3242415 RepID=UPI00352A113D